MRITRAAKVAAFPLIVLALVALVACQGGPGTKGDKGDKGDMGDMGTPGQTGGSGTDALTARGDGARVVWIDDGESAAAKPVIGNLPSPIDMSMDFRGGYKPITYGVEMVPSSASTFLGKIDETSGILAITLRTAADIDPAGDYELNDNDATMNSTITVTATDIEGNEAEKVVNVLTNKAPTAPGADTVWVASVGTEMRADKKVVACSLRNDAAIAAANTAHKCTLAATNTQFDDDGDLTLSVVRPSLKASVTADKNVLTITGLASTWNPKGGDDDTGAHEGTEVMIRATDDNGLYVDRALRITVDAAPMVVRNIDSRTLEDLGKPVEVARTVIVFFSDDSNTAVAVTTASVDSSDKGTATAEVDGTTGHLTVTPLNPGTTEISVTAMEGTALEQKVTQKFMVTVTNSNP